MPVLPALSLLQPLSWQGLFSQLGDYWDVDPQKALLSMLVRAALSVDPPMRRSYAHRSGEPDTLH